ncbi:MAG: hypothetical protein ACRYFS_16930 [Janthinobacterium lividum]
MPKPRHKPPLALSLPRLLVPVSLGIVLALSILGFVHFTQITLYQQKHFAPDSAHPWDGYAAACLFLIMVSLAGLLLNKRDPAPMRWRRTRVSKRIRTRAKPRPGSGTIKRQ